MSALDVILHDLDLDDYTPSFLDEAAKELSALRSAVADRDAAIARAVAEEREECAAKCHDISSKDSIWRYEVRAGAEMCESAIRARGDRKERERVIDAVNELSKLIGGML